MERSDPYRGGSRTRLVTRRDVQEEEEAKEAEAACRSITSTTAVPHCRAVVAHRASSSTMNPVRPPSIAAKVQEGSAFRAWQDQLATRDRPVQKVISFKTIASRFPPSGPTNSASKNAFIPPAATEAAGRNRAQGRDGSGGLRVKVRQGKFVKSTIIPHPYARGCLRNESENDNFDGGIENRAANGLRIGCMQPSRGRHAAATGIATGLLTDVDTASTFATASSRFRGTGKNVLTDATNAGAAANVGNVENRFLLLRTTADEMKSVPLEDLVGNR